MIPKYQRAVHESGHAVMAIALGGTALEVDLISGTGVDNSSANIRGPGCGSKRAMICIAGEVAEYLYTHGPTPVYVDEDELRSLIAHARAGTEPDDDGVIVFTEILKAVPEATDDELIEGYYGFTASCRELLHLPVIAKAVDELAEVLTKKSWLGMNSIYATVDAFAVQEAAGITGPYMGVIPQAT